MKGLRLVSAVAILALAIVGCGGGGGGGGSGYLPAVQPAAAPAAHPAPAAGSTTDSTPQTPKDVPSPPEGLHYARDSVVYPVGAAIAPNTPAHSGGAIDRYTIEPALPAGLAINATSGVISGTPQAPSNAILFTVTGRNASGSATAGVRIEISQRVMAPANLHYADEAPIYRIGQAMVPNVPTADGGAFTQITVTPSLPSGIKLDPVTGVISGTPTLLSPRTNYTVTVSNSAGSSSVVLGLSVESTTPAPASLGYREQRALYGVGQTIMPNLPVSTGGAITRFGVVPALPSGLSLNAISGAISGTPQSVQAATSYVVTGSNAAGSASSTVYITVVATGSIVPTGSMNLLRTASVSALLSDGRVMVVGGGYTNTSYGPPTNTAELYDMATGQWTATGSMRDPRSSHALTPLADGRVLVVGGIYTNPVAPRALSTAELYDPVTGQWTVTGSTNVARYGHTATLLLNGKVLVTSGDQSGSGASTAELYDPSTGQWTVTGSLSDARAGHMATLLPNGKVLVFGGATGHALATAELYDPVSGSWSATGSMIDKRSGHSATLLPNGKVLTAGGSSQVLQSLNTAELYDPSTGQWTATGAMSGTRFLHSATLLSNGMVLFAGGTNDGGGSYLSTLELYDSTTGQWTAGGSMGEARLGHIATRLTDGKVLIAGGVASGGLLNSAELYVPAP